MTTEFYLNSQEIKRSIAKYVNHKLGTKYSEKDIGLYIDSGKFTAVIHGEDVDLSKDKEAFR